jgi:AraC-like DNA-binding protein
LLGSHTFNLDSLAAHHRVAAWRDYVCRVFIELDCQAIDAELTGQLIFYDLSGVQLSKVTTVPQRVIRSRAMISRAEERYIMVNVPRSGVYSGTQDGRDVRLQPGDLAIYDSTRPYQLDLSEPFELLVLKIPIERFSSQPIDLDQFTARRVRGEAGLGAMLSQFVQGAWDRIAEFNPNEVKFLANELIALLVAALLNIEGGTNCDGSHHRGLMKQRIRNFIEVHLGDPNLTVERIAAEHRVTPRYLHQLFENEEYSLSRWIWRRRLDMIKRDLSHPGLKHFSLTEIAYRWGFSSSSHFSRTFRHHFSMSPSDFRQLQCEKLPTAH